jgi:small subunit ribosomal protein S8
VICSDPIADMLTRIRNGLLARKKSVAIPYSKIKEGIAQILSNLGFILGYSLQEINSFQKEIIVKLKYINREPAILGLQRESRPGRRVYIGSKYKNTNRPQHSVFILTTSKGVLSAKEAREQGVGGELLCAVW